MAPALILTSPPAPKKPPTRLPLLCSRIRAVQTYTTDFLIVSDVLDFCKDSGHPEQCQESWTFPQLRLLCCICRQASAFCISSRPCPRGQMPRGVGKAGGLSFGPCRRHQSLQLFMPELNHPWELVLCWQLREFSFWCFRHYCFSSVLFTPSRIPHGSLLSLQDSVSISPLPSHHIHVFLPFL